MNGSQNEEGDEIINEYSNHDYKLSEKEHVMVLMMVNFELDKISKIIHDNLNNNKTNLTE